MFHELRVASIVQETPDAKSIVLDVPESLAPGFEYRAGQFVTVEVEIDGERLRRSYSLASSPDSERVHKVTVKRVRGGRVSCWLNDRLREGDVLSVTRPEGRFVLDASDAPLLLFAAGSGITPVISLLKTALARTERAIALLYANRDAPSVIFAKELAALEAAHPRRLRVLHRIDDVHGLVDEPTIRTFASETLESSCYLCGPALFMTLVEQALSRAGVPEDRIRIERFVSPPPQATAQSAAAEGSETGDTPAFVDITLAGTSHRIAYVPGKTLLQTARDAGLDAPFSCEEGFCGCCASYLLEGRVVMAADDALSLGEKRRGMILACQSRPVTSRCAFRFVEG
jgi:3-ketosteroid 9alpha-monooxygenase subunit B